MTAETIAAGVLIVVGLVGILLPILPGLLLVLAGIAVWAVPRGDTVGWTVLGVATAIVVIGSQSLGSVIEDALRRELATGHDNGPRPKVPVFDGGTGPRPGLDLTSNRALYELLDEGLDARR